MVVIFLDAATKMRSVKSAAAMVVAIATGLEEVAVAVKRQWVVRLVKEEVMVMVMVGALAAAIAVVMKVPVVGIPV